MLTCRIKDVYKALDHKGKGILECFFFSSWYLIAKRKGGRGGEGGSGAAMPDTVLFVCV